MRIARGLSDPDRRWGEFVRRGRRLAVLFAALWFGGIAVLFRLAPVPAPAAHASPPQVAWRPGAPATALDAQTLFSPAVFALPAPAGFSHALRDERIRLAPPVEGSRPSLAFLPPPPPAAGEPSFSRGVPAPGVAGMGWSPPAGVFPPRNPEADAPRMVFSDGWESRLFSGIDLNFDQWTNVGWTARIEIRFDGRGVPDAVAVAQASGLPELDRRLARSVYGWRLLDAGTSRTGTVAWNSPAGASAPAAARTEAP